MADSQSASHPSADNIRACEFVVTGRVQGVAYRASTVAEAERLGLVGIVKNQADGSVWIHAEGSEEALQQLEAWCARGPRFAKVEAIDKSAAAVEGYAGFRIEY